MSQEHTTGIISVEAEYSDRMPLPNLRWSKSGVLQQAWHVKYYKSGKSIDHAVEWEDVPHEQ